MAVPEEQKKKNKKESFSPRTKNRTFAKLRSRRTNLPPPRPNPSENEVLKAFLIPPRNVNDIESVTKSRPSSFLSKCVDVQVDNTDKSNWMTHGQPCDCGCWLFKNCCKRRAGESLWRLVIKSFHLWRWSWCRRCFGGCCLIHLALVASNHMFPWDCSPLPALTLPTVDIFLLKVGYVWFTPLVGDSVLTTPAGRYPAHVPAGIFSLNVVAHNS